MAMGIKEFILAMLYSCGFIALIKGFRIDDGKLYGNSVYFLGFCGLLTVILEDYPVLRIFGVCIALWALLEFKWKEFDPMIKRIFKNRK